jgi:dTDP-4-dehydrorhamnose reductase
MASQRLLIIGATGFLGTHAVRSSAGKFEVIRGERRANGEPGTVHLDISDVASVDRAFADVRPDCVLLLAAMSDIDWCEAWPERAFAANARGAENVANACAQSNARLLFTSSAAVFDGKKHGYSEQDRTSPLSVYGKTKAWAENAVKTLLPASIILRFGLVLGFAHKSGTNAMLDNIFQKWKAGETVHFPIREMRNPIDAQSLSAIMIGMLSNSELSGVYHVGSSDSISRYELGKRLAARAGVSPSLVRPQDSPTPGRAPRGEDHFLLTDKIHNVCHVETVSSDQVIERCFS